MEWRRGFIRMCVERDLPQLGSRIASSTMRRLWTMLAHYHGQTWNSSKFARSFGVADTTVRHYLDLLTSAFVVRRLQPWHANSGKRQVKAPKAGASWKGFVIEQLATHLRAEPEERFFWATHTGAELDLLVVRGRWVGSAMVHVPSLGPEGLEDFEPPPSMRDTMGRTEPQVW